jgi:BNR repeat-like domain
MRRLSVLLLALALAAPAAAATIHGTARAELLLGKPGPDRITAGAGNDFVQAAFGAVDRVDCGRGRDVVTADAADEVAASCEIVSRRLSNDLSTNVRSQHETAVEPDDFAWGSSVLAVYQVARFRGGASSNIGFAFSRDAGRTWQRGLLPGVTVESSPPGTEVAASDPSVVFDAAHGVWLVSTLTLEQDGSQVLVARSADGVHWAPPVSTASGPILDKEWLACDNSASSPFHGRCYVLYTDDQKNWTVSQSTDDGGLTWSAPVRATGMLVGTQPVVRGDGTLVVIAGAYAGEGGRTGSIEEVRSTDGGATFTRSSVSTFQSAPTSPLRSLALPSMEIDGAGTLYVVWDDCRFRADCTANDLVLTKSADGGLTWTAPTRIPLAGTTSTLSAFVPGLGADPARAGHLGLVYAYFLPGSCARGSCLLGTAVTSSADGGERWAKPQQLHAQPMQLTWLAQTTSGRMVGDYFSTTFAANRMVPVFALAVPPLNGRFREAVFATSLPAR